MFRIICLLFCLAALTACDKADVSGLVEKVKGTAAEQAQQIQQSVTQAVQEQAGDAREMLQLAGNMQLTLDAPLTCGAAYYELTSPIGSRPAVLRIATYRAADQEQFPSAYLHAQLGPEAAVGLAGQVVSASLFVQVAADGPLWSTQTGEHVELKINSLDAQYLRAELLGGSLQDAATGGVTSVTGKIEAIPLAASGREAQP